MLPQILIAVNTDDERGRRELHFTLNQNRVQKWFGEGSKELLSLAAQGFQVHPETAETTKYLLSLAADKIRSS